MASKQHAAPSAFALGRDQGGVQDRRPRQVWVTVAHAFAAVREAAGHVAEWKLPYWIFKSLEGMSLACNPFPYLTDLGLADGLHGDLVDLILPPS